VRWGGVEARRIPFFEWRIEKNPLCVKYNHGDVADYYDLFEWLAGQSVNLVVLIAYCGQERVFANTMFRQKGTSTPVERSSAVIATTGNLRSESAKVSIETNRRLFRLLLK